MIVTTLIVLVVLLVLLLIALRVGARQEAPPPQPESHLLRTSGVYSVVRRSPREAVLAVKPTEDEIRKYLAGKNEDSKGAALSPGDKQHLLQAFFEDLDHNVGEVEAGDEEGVEFYYYDHEKSDPVCEGLVNKGHFVTREDLYRYPRLVPPFHIGCTCRLTRQRVTDNVRNTIAVNLRPLLTDDKAPPRLPNWHAIAKPQ